jgi:adenine-specific DNA-methyltransferase
MTDLELLPIKEPRKRESNIVELFSLILIHKLNSAIESVLNAVVFNIYFPDHMKERGIDVLEFVEQDIKELMQGRDFEKLSDAEKEQVIEALHSKWSHPDNEVRNRIKLFAVRSPEILKPILES